MGEKLLIGRMIDTGSWVHSIDSRAKMTAMLLYVGMIVMARSWLVLGVVGAFSIVIMMATRIPLTYFIKATKPLRVLMLFILIIQCLTIRGGTVLVRFGNWHIDSLGLHNGLQSVIRMALLVSFTAVLTFTTTPGRLNQGLEGMLRPLRRCGVSPERLTLMLSIALRFIPTIMDEAQTVLKAQASRGADLKELPWIEKGKMLVALLVPITVGAFRRAEDLVHSMESRCYRMGAPRTAYHLLHWSRRDTLFIGMFIIMTFGALAMTLLMGSSG